MRRFRAWFVRLSGLLGRQRRERELAEEIESHLQLHIEDNLRAGMTPEEARRQALIKLGGVEQTKEAYRARRGLPLVETLWQDVGFGLRMLRMSPGFTVVAVLTLALGIGANTAIFSLFDAALLRPLPVPEPEQLVNFFVQNEGRLDSGFDYPLYADYRDRNTVLEGLAAFGYTTASLTTGAGTERVRGLIVSGNLFEVLRLQPSRGRFFLPEEDRTPNSHPVVVLSEGLWRRRFGGDVNVVGHEVVVNGSKFTVVGVAPPNFTGMIRGFVPEIYVPMHMFATVNPGWPDDPLSQRRYVWLRMIGRVRSGVSREQAQTAMRTLALQIKAAGMINTETGLVLADGSRGVTEYVEDLNEPMQLLQLAVGVVLLIACANLTGLLLARALARRKEVAMRLALGAGRLRLARQLLTESLMLSTLGGGAGIVLAPWVAHFLLRFRPSLALALDVGTDWRVLVFSFAATLVTGIIFGLAPAWQASRVELVPTLKEERSSFGLTRRWNLRSVLVAAQIALTVALLACAGLSVHSLWGLYSIDAGFDPEKILLAAVDVGRGGYNAERGRTFYVELHEQLKAIPGVEAAGLAQIVPLSGGVIRGTMFPEGYVSPDGGGIPLYQNVVSLEWFRAMGIPLRQGRDFSSRDTAISPRVAIVNEALASQFWPGRDALGMRISYGGEPGKPEMSMEVVGVVADSKYIGLTDAVPPTVYVPMEQRYGGAATIFLRTKGDPRAFVEPVRRLVRSLDASLPVFGVRTLEEQRSLSLATPRLAAALLSSLAVLALLLAVFGLYGVLAYSVAQRTREIGVRMALGAQPSDILRLVIRQWMALVLIGLAAGVPAALAAARLVRALLYGVTPHDPWTFGAVIVVLVLAALAACYGPARRAMRADPLEALRFE